PALAPPPSQQTVGFGSTSARSSVNFAHPMDLQPAFSALPAPLARALAERGFTELTVVQQAVSEAAVEGRDLRVSSRTGSGKTVALGIVLGRTLAEDASPRPYGAAQPRALLIAPTRELAAQIG